MLPTPDFATVLLSPGRRLWRPTLRALATYAESALRKQSPLGANVIISTNVCLYFESEETWFPTMCDLL